MKLKFTQLLAFSTLLCVFSNAQNTLNSPRNFYQIQKQFYSRYTQLEKRGSVEKKEVGEKEDGLITKFHRWEYLMRSRTFPSGNLPDGNIQWNEWQKFMESNAAGFAARTAAQPVWQQVGSNTVPSQGGGIGRVNVVRIDPNNTNTIYIGSAGGGVWKTTNGGTTWSCLSDNFPVTSISDIAIDATNPNNIYVATGDEDGYEATWQSDNDFWGGVYTAGILRSMDGGTTWERVSMRVAQSNNELVQRMLINPVNNKVLLAASRRGIFRTVTGGKAWENVLPAHCHDMEWKPGSPNVVYAGGNGVLYRSKDAGATWKILKSGLGGGRMTIEVSEASPLVIYSLSETGTFYKSSDGGATWVAKSYPYAAGFYGYYDLTLGCSQADADVLIAGGLNTAKSINGGTSWTTIDNWSSYTSPNYVHADKHAAVFFPGSTTNALVGCDGGIFKTTNGGTSWTDLSNGLMLAQIYRVGITPQNPDLVTSGWQDNGCNKWDGTNWTRIYGADGMGTEIDYTNENTIYESYQYGSLQRSYNGGATWSYIAPSGGAWVTPFIIDPVISSRLYYASFSLYKSNNQGTSWSTVPGVSLGDYGTAIAVAPSNNNIVYAASLGKMYRADISAGTAYNITAGLPVSQAGINYIAVNNQDENQVFVALSGYSAGNKVFYTPNGGATWQNISGNLFNLPVNTIVYQNNSGIVYIGTDIGVFYLDNTSANWQSYGSGLPNVMVHELKINYGSNKLVAGTYGRGIWQVDLVSPSRPVTRTVAVENVKEKIQPAGEVLKVNIAPNPTSGKLNIQVQNATADVSVEVYRLSGDKILTYNFSKEDASSMQINLRGQITGNYVLHIRSGEAIVTREITLTK